MAQLESAHPNLHGRSNWWLDLKRERITHIDGNSLRVLLDPVSAEQRSGLPGFSTATGEVLFQDCEFPSGADFHDLTIPGRTSFVGADIKSQVDFTGGRSSTPPPRRVVPCDTGTARYGVESQRGLRARRRAPR